MNRSGLNELLSVSLALLHFTFFVAKVIFSPSV